MSGEGGVITTDLSTVVLLSCCVRGRRSYNNRPVYCGTAHCCPAVSGEGGVITTDLSTVVLLTVVLLCQGKEEL